jgi:uncharacterized OsmC-like protein
MHFQVVYQGDLRTQAEHLASENLIITDAPTDNHGKGEAFSPTDLLSVSLACCQMTIMGIVANRENIELKGIRAMVKKVMAADPRRVSEIHIVYTKPESLVLSDKQKAMLINAAKTCPVAYSLHPDIKQNTEFLF